MRKAATAAIALLAIAFSYPGNAQDRSLKFATEGAYPPFNRTTADGKLEGFDVDIGNALCVRIKARCEWVTQDWDGMIPALMAGKFDAIVASMFITPERKEKVDFTDRYYRTPAATLVRKDGGIAGTTAEDLKGKSVGVQASSVYAIYAEKHLPESDAKPYPTVDEMFIELANGRLDAVNDDMVVIKKFLETPEGACCQIAGTIEPIPEIHGPGAGIAVRKGDPLKAELDAAIQAIRADGTYKQIADRYFDFDIYGTP